MFFLSLGKQGTFAWETRYSTRCSLTVKRLKYSVDLLSGKAGKDSTSYTCTRLKQNTNIVLKLA